MSLKIALRDNDHVVRAKTDLSDKGQENSFRSFICQVREELVPGQTAYLEIEDSKTDPITFEITQFE
jgi:hypothetical protein